MLTASIIRAIMEAVSTSETSVIIYTATTQLKRLSSSVICCYLLVHSTKFYQLILKLLNDAAEAAKVIMLKETER
jgi:hypothetical protein